MTSNGKANVSDRIQVILDWAGQSETKVPPGVLDYLTEEQLQKWELEYIEPFGRCLVARKNIKEGDVLFVDHPVATGPKQSCGPICLGCYLQMDTESIRLCSKCGWSVCSPECEKRGYHPLECAAFMKTEYRPKIEDFSSDPSIYEAIMPFRCYLLRNSAPSKWRTMEAMESHDNLRRGTELWISEQKNVIEYLKDVVKLDVDGDVLHHIIGALDVNCHEVRSNIPGTENEYRVRGLYPLCAMMTHDCSSNSHHTVMDDMSMLVIASRDIKKGHQVTDYRTVGITEFHSNITIFLCFNPMLAFMLGTYTHLLAGTIERRKHLKYGKFFDCICSRCSDPTEFGTYFNALKCTQSGCDGFMLSINPLDPNNAAPWRCQKCSYQVEVGQVNKLTNLIYYELGNVGENDPMALEDVFRKYQAILHPNHFHLVGIKHSLSQLYGRVRGFFLNDLSPKLLERKMQCCRELLVILDKLDPGIARLRGLTLYELHAPILLTANRAFQNKNTTKSDFLSRLKETQSLLDSAIHCLQFEPVSSFEGTICKIARGSASELCKWITIVEDLPESQFLPEVNLKESTPVTLSDSDLTLEALLAELETY